MASGARASPSQIQPGWNIPYVARKRGRRSKQVTLPAPHAAKHDLGASEFRADSLSDRCEGRSRRTAPLTGAVRLKAFRPKLGQGEPYAAYLDSRLGRSSIR